MQKRGWVVISLTMALMGLFVMGCAQSSSEQVSIASGEIVVKATEWKLEPATIRVEAGKPIKLVLRNEGKIEHNVTFPGITVGGKAVEVAAKPGETASLEFTPEKSGVYEMVCGLPAHKDAGMVGKIEVVAAGSAATAR